MAAERELLTQDRQPEASTHPHLSCFCHSWPISRLTPRPSGSRCSSCRAPWAAAKVKSTASSDVRSIVILPWWGTATRGGAAADWPLLSQGLPPRARCWMRCSKLSEAVLRHPRRPEAARRSCCCRVQDNELQGAAPQLKAPVQNASVAIRPSFQTLASLHGRCRAAAQVCG